MQVNNILGRLQLCLLIFSIVYALLLLTSRLTGLIPDLFSWVTVLCPLALSLLTSLLIPFRVSQRESARAVDTHEKTDDLFLTVSSIGKSNGKFKDLVSEQAEQKALNLKPGSIVSFKWQKPLRNFALATIALLIGIFTLPQLDPFGKEDERAKKELKNKSLEEARKETEKRLVKIKKEIEKPKDSEAAKVELTQILKQLKTKPPEDVRNKLRQQRRKMAKMWSDKNKEINADNKRLQISSQSFGFNSKELKKISKDLKKGDTQSAIKKLSELKDKLEALSEGELSEDKKQELASIKKEMEDLRDAINESMGSESVKAAINRALSQMEELSEETKEALADAAKSMKLSERELSRLQKMMDEMDDLQQMMQAAQQADQLAQQMQNNPNAQTPPEYESFQEYQDYLNQMNQNGQQNGESTTCQACEGAGKCKSCNGTGKDGEGNKCPDCEGKGQCSDCKGTGNCNGNGSGQGQGLASGNGTGNGTTGGGLPGENDVASNTVKQNAKSKTQPGRILMEWKTKGLSDKGQVTEEYQEAMKEIREGVDEAISKEKIPPGYHEIIKKYFSSEGLETGEQEQH